MFSPIKESADYSYYTFRCAELQGSSLFQIWKSIGAKLGYIGLLYRELDESKERARKDLEMAFNSLSQKTKNRIKEKWQK